MAEEYYNQTSSGFGGFVKLPRQAAGRLPRRSAPVTRETRATRRCAGGRLDDGRPRVRRLPFSPHGIEVLTRFARTDEGPADFAERGHAHWSRASAR